MAEVRFANGAVIVLVGAVGLPYVSCSPHPPVMPVETDVARADVVTALSGRYPTVDWEARVPQRRWVSMSEIGELVRGQ